MLTLDVRPSKRLILLYALIYGVTLALVFQYDRTWPLPLCVIIIISISSAALFSLQPLWCLKKLSLLPKGEIQLEFKHFSVKYDDIRVCHQGVTFMMLHCKRKDQACYVLCLADRFSSKDFETLQRWIRTL